MPNVSCTYWCTQLVSIIHVFMWTSPRLDCSLITAPHKQNNTLSDSKWSLALTFVYHWYKLHASAFRCKTCHRQQRACPVYAMSTLSSAEKRLTPCWTDSARSEISSHRSPRHQPHRNNLASLTSHNTHSQSHTTGTNSFFFARLYIINPFCFLFKNYPCSTRKYVQLFFFFSLSVFIMAIPFVSIARRESFLSAQHEKLFLYVFVLLKKKLVWI